MFKLPESKTTVDERAILRKLRVWIVALAVACLLAGAGIGAMLSGRPTVAQNEAQIARAPEVFCQRMSALPSPLKSLFTGDATILKTLPLLRSVM